MLYGHVADRFSFITVVLSKSLIDGFGNLRVRKLRVVALYRQTRVTVAEVFGGIEKIEFLLHVRHGRIVIQLVAESLDAELVLLKSAPPPPGSLAELSAAGYVDEEFPRAARPLRRVTLVNLRNPGQLASVREFRPSGAC